MNVNLPPFQAIYLCRVSSNVLWTLGALSTIYRSRALELYMDIFTCQPHHQPSAAVQRSPAGHDHLTLPPRLRSFAAHTQAVFEIHDELQVPDRAEVGRVYGVSLASHCLIAAWRKPYICSIFASMPWCIGQFLGFMVCQPIRRLLVGEPFYPVNGRVGPRRIEYKHSTDTCCRCVQGVLRGSRYVVWS